MLRRFLWVLLCCLSTGASLAQTLEFGLTTNSTLQFEPEITLSNLSLRDTRLALRLAGGISGPLEFGLQMRETSSFGPAGNILLTGQADLNSLGAYDLSLGAEGVIASIAASLKSSVFNTEAGAFVLADAFTDDTRASFPVTDWAAAFDLSFSYRLNRGLILNAAPSFYISSGQSIGGRLGLETRLLKLFSDDDLSFKALAYLSPGASNGYGAFGIDYKVNQRRLPAMNASLWLGAGTKGIWPGLEASISQKLSDLNLAYSASLWLEPFRTDMPLLRANANLDYSLATGTLGTSLFARYADQPDLSLTLYYRLNF